MAQVKVFSLGGLGSPCCCGGTGCITTICVTGCNGAQVQGATVTVKSGDTTIATGTTDASGCTAINIGSAGSYTVDVTATGYDDYSGTKDLACPGTTTIALTGSGGAYSCVCCQGYIDYLTTTLYLTDANGTYPLVYNGALGWSCCYTIILANTLGLDGDGNCTVIDSFAVAINYGLSCASGLGLFVERFWQVKTYGGGCFGWNYGSSATNPCISVDCGNTVETSTSDNIKQPCSVPINWTFDLTPNGANCSTDPVGGGVVISS